MSFLQSLAAAFKGGGDRVPLARAFPETSIVLDHVGTPLGVAGYAGRREERFDAWRLSQGRRLVLASTNAALPFLSTGTVSTRAGDGWRNT